MIRFTIDGDQEGPGYVLRAEADHDECEPQIDSGALPDARAIALQARELVDAAASLLESLPEHEAAFEALHDAFDALPTGAAGG